MEHCAAVVFFYWKLDCVTLRPLRRRRLTSTRKFFTFNSGAKGGCSPQVYLAAGRHSEAKQMFEDSITICQQIGDRSKEASALSGMGRTLRLAGDLEGARQKEEQARGVFAEIGDRAQEA